MAMRSAAGLNARPVANVGTRAAATQVVAKMRYGALRKIHDALSASTTSLRSSLCRSRYGWMRSGPRRRRRCAFTLRT